MNFQKFTTFKTILIALVLTINANQLFAQTTNGIFFQAVARDNFSNPAKDRKIYVQSSIIQTTPTGTKVLTEEHQANTDATGVFSISLGNGVRVGGTASNLTTIDWSKGPFYLNLKVAITPIGGNNNWDYNKEWVDMGTTSFGAVPFALYSASSAKVDDKLNANDTTKMLAVYAKAIKVQSLETAVASKLTAADTLTMLAPYAKAAYTIDSSFFKSQLATKLSLSDTINYTKQKYTDSAIAKKLNIADSSIYVTKSQLASYNFSSGGTTTTTTSVTMDTTSLSNRINLKANTSDLTALNTSVTSNTASITANTASITTNTTAINLKAPIASPLFTGTVGIGTTNPSSAAALDITSTTQGLLLPRLTYVQKTAISNPVAGLILFCSDCGTSGEMQLYNGTSFVNMIGGTAQFALPVISATTGAYSITTSSAISGGEITSDGGASITARGLVWGTSTGSSTYSVTAGTGTGTFTSSITGLTSGITYYIRAFATNSVGTKYGSEITLNTAQAVATLAATTTVSDISSTTATSGGNITYNGGATVTARGVVWSTTSTPTIAITTKTTDGAASGAYTSNITGLTPGTLYYVRSYATNSVGTSYGAQTSFTTLNTATIAATVSATSITSNSATTGGDITSDGGATVTSRGLVYGTSAGSSTFSVTSGTGTGTYTIGLTGLLPATTYYVRSFATNSVGTVYGTETNFTTIAIAPTLTTTAASNVTKYAASTGGTITSNGGSTITASGICWSTTATPTISDSKTTDGTTSGTFTSSLTSLTAGTTYYVRAYATNAIGTGYGALESFTTLSTSSNNPALDATTTATSITANSAILGGNITDEGATQVSARGLVYGTTTGSATYSVTVGSGTGTFTSTLTGLTQGATYYVRSFATNVQGTSYGDETSFTTQTIPTVSVTATPTSLTTTSAVGGGTISSTGGASITTSGLVWDANANPDITLSTKTTDGTTSGTFTSSITGLTQGATYHVRAYATNYLGTSYGPNITFTTLTTPTVSATATISSISGTTATTGGTITSDGGAEVTARGVVYGTSTGSATFSVTTGTGTGTYSISLTGLLPATTYYVRSFATNSVGTVYGTETSFTSNAIVPTLTTTAASSITKYAASAGGTITSNGGSAITVSGICWSTTATPTISDSKTIDGTTSGTFTSNITGLNAGTTYYVRAYATNAIGTSYGPNESFTTLSTSSNNPALDATTTATGITANSAILGGNVTDEGATQVSVRGLVYGTTTGSATYSVTVGSGAGTFTSTLTGLAQGTKYFVRSFATNVQGTSYGSETSFTTQTTPTVSVTATPTSITTTTAIGGGTISSTGGATITISGLVWGTSTDPEITLTTKTTDGTTSGTFTSSITGLTQGATYHVRAYATNYLGTSYGPNITFTTITTPTISATASAISITSSTATIGGTITADGGATITSRGLVYGTSAGSATYSVTSGTGTGTYTISLTGLTPATTYFVRSFATNSVGTVYGTETSFATIAIAPTLTTTAASSITKYAASAGGTITSNGGSTITASGICWSTTATPTTSDFKSTDGITSGTFTSSITGLTAGTTYYVRAYATNAIGTSYGAAQSFTTLPPPQSQSTVLIGTQRWTDKNLEVTTYRNGDAITYAANATEWNTATNAGIGAWSYYNFDPANGAIYGKLYNWYAVADSRLLAPAGYHISTKVEYNTLSSNSASSLKSTSSEWGVQIGTNTTGFTGLPGGNNNITSRSQFEDKGTSGWFWTSDVDPSDNSKAYLRLLHRTSGFIEFSVIKLLGASVRLVKDNNAFETGPTNPVLEATTSATSITANSAILGGNVTDEGATQVSSRGLVYGITSGSSTYSVTVGSGGGTFTSTISGLTQGTKYFVRSFATNTQGTSYGAETSFTTQTTPTVSVTTTPTSITTTTAIGGGTISSTGGATITTSGLVWGASTNPEITLTTKTTNGATSGTFTSSITGLTQGTTYHVRAYATNYLGTSYGPNITFTTITTPTVSSTATVTSITGTTATSGGTITVDGGATVTSRGVVWGTTTGSSTFSATSGTSTGTYPSNLSGLSIATTYFVRAFATNSAGTAYGPEVQFATPNTATVASTITSTITSSTAILGGVLSSTGGATTAIGIMYSTSSSFGTYSTTTINANAVAGTYTTTISGLSELTTYYAKAFATNTAGTTYGPTINFSTPVLPLTVGTTYQGGIIFYLFQSGDPGYVAGQTHGLIASTSDQSTYTDWKNNGGWNDITTGTGIGTGLANTNAIIASHGSSATYAAGRARAHNGGGYTDWYLPSRDELYKMHITIGQGANNIANLRSEKYWSSSQYESHTWQAYYMYAQTGNVQTVWKDVGMAVRAIRTF